MRQIRLRAWDNEYRKMHTENSWKDFAGYPPNFTFMLSTNRYDKDGTEIFEGDIIKYGHKLFVVRFGDADIEDGDMVNTNHVIGFYLEAVGEQQKGYKYWHMDYIDDYEVVGTVYENSELLK